MWKIVLTCFGCVAHNPPPLPTQSFPTLAACMSAMSDYTAKLQKNLEEGNGLESHCVKR